MKQILIKVKHFLIVLTVLLTFGFGLLVWNKGSISLGTDELAYKVGDEGPYAFIEDDKLKLMTIRGHGDSGFWVEEETVPLNTSVKTQFYFALEDKFFSINIQPNITSPPVIYNDNEPIMAISDLESNFKTFRDFLVTHEVLDQDLRWQFGKGHLVLVGDMLDRGHATVQLLWFIHDLEQQALAAGGRVHYIIGNHEIKNLYGDFTSTSNRYIPIAGILGKQQADLLSDKALLGRWLASKNTLEKINGYLFVHGGIHPKIAKLSLDLNSINQMVRANYRKYYFPHRDMNEIERLLTSNKTGPAWYRGYFRDEVSEREVDSILNSFDAKGIVVGHTIQFKVNTQFSGKVFAIDVKHPGDYSINIPAKSSEGLLIDNHQTFRLLDDGSREKL